MSLFTLVSITLKPGFQPKRRFAALLYALASLSLIGTSLAQPPACAPSCFLAQTGGGTTQAPAAPGRPAQPDAKTIEKYGLALALGDRVGQFVPEITAIFEAVQRGESGAVAAAVQALYAKAKRPVPQGDALDQLLSRLPPPVSSGQSASSGGTTTPSSGSATAPTGTPAGSGPLLPLGGASNPGTTAAGSDLNLPLGEGSGPTLSGASSAKSTDSTQTDSYIGSQGGGSAVPSGTHPPTTAGSGREINLPLGEEPKATDAGAAPKCVATGPVTIDQLIGSWTDDATGAEVEIKKETTVRQENGIEFHGRHTWHGDFEGQKLTVTRKPVVEEMGDAPEWAKEQANGKIEWKLELDAKSECGQLVLEGKWYPGSYEWSAEADADSAAPANRAVADFGAGTPIVKKYTKPPPAISDVIVLTDQTAFIAGERPKWPYSEATSGERVLFVYGRGLPRSWSDKIEFKSEDPRVSYFAVALSAEKDLPPLRQEQFETGWREARKNLDADTIQITRGLTAMLVYARVKSRVLPGMKKFTLNGTDGAWRLRYGDDRASLSFMRAITEDIADPTSTLVLPERVFLEVRTSAAFPLDAIPLKLQLNETTLSWGGAASLMARRISPTVYRTDTIELVEAGRPMPAAEAGVYFLPAHVNDKLNVRLEDPFLFGLTPASLVTNILRTPAELGETWKEALLRAAKADGIPGFAGGPQTISDWNQLSAAQATEFANFAVTPIILKTLTSATALGFLSYVPKVNRFMQEVERGKLRETTKVTVGDHAALLLLRDQFVKGMKAAAKNVELIKGEAALRGYREAIKASAWDENSPWRYLRVTCPGGSGDCALPMVVSDSYLERTFGTDRQAADEWIRKAVEEALRNYRQATQDAIAKAEGIPDSDVKALLKLVGYSYLPLLPAVQARMMRLVEINGKNEIIDDVVRIQVEQGKAEDPGLIHDLEAVRSLWVPDLNGRYKLRNLHTVVEAVQAQEDYAKLDTQMAMLMASAATAPFMLEEGAIAAVIGWGTDTAFLAVSLATDVPEYLESREEIRFALGASIILGTQRLQEAELKKTEWFQVLASVGPAALGSVLSTVRMVGVVRTSLILSKIESGGLKAYEALSAADKAAFWRYATESKLLEELGETKAITQTHRRALAATEKVLDELGLKAPELPKTKTLTAVGEPGSLPKTQTPQEPSEPMGSTIGFNKEGEPVQVQSGEFIPLDDSAKPGDKTDSLSTPDQPPKPKDEPRKPRGGTVQVGGGALGDFGPGDLLAMKKPEVGGEFTLRQDGQLIAVKLRAKLGEGGYAKAFVIVDSRIPGCAKGCAIKIYEPDEADLFFGVGRDQVNYIQQGAAELGDDILQLKNLYYAPDAPRPYIIQELLGDTEDWMYFSKDKWADPSEVLAEFRKRPELREATLELFTKMRDKGLIWEDCHLRNIYYRKINGKWMAGILDQDRIVKWSADRRKLGNLGAFFGAAESHYMPKHLKSLEAFKAQARFPQGLGQAGEDALRYYRDHPGPYLSDIDLFWEKSLERKGWLQFDAGEYREGLLLPDDVEKKFPRLRDAERLGPFDPAIEFNKPRGASLNIVPFGRQRQFAQVPAADLPLAA